MARVLKNITGSNIQLEDVGQIIIPASSQVTLDPIDYLKWARSENTISSLSSGNLVLVDDGVELSSSEAVRLIQKLFNLKLSESTIVAGQSIKELNLIGDYTLNISDEVATINFAPNVVNGKGSLLQPFFLGEGILRADRWLTYSDTDLERSDDVFYVVPYDCKLVGITYSNNRYNSDCDIEVYKALRNDDDNKTLEYTFEVRDSRLSLKTNISNGPSFLPGDKISVFYTAQGVSSDDLVATLYLLITSMDGYENSESFIT